MGSLPSIKKGFSKVRRTYPHLGVPSFFGKFRLVSLSSLLVFSLLGFVLNCGGGGGGTSGGGSGNEGDTPPSQQEPPSQDEAPRPLDSWSQMSEPPLEQRNGHTALWTGEKMIIWGGADTAESGAYRHGDGAIYTPNGSGGSWTNMSATGAPSARNGHTGIWTGEKMIIWGGRSNAVINDGAIYTPDASGGGSWANISTNNAPSAREFHTALWTGDKMIVWGGQGNAGKLNDGAIYTPDASGGSWASINANGAPSARTGHTALWTGEKMIIWGGHGSAGRLNDGAIYTPDASGGSWASINANGAPSARNGHTALWTGEKMIIWGGYGGAISLGDGAIYTPDDSGGGSWTSISTGEAPSARYDHTALWTGEKMIIWGGDSDDATSLGDGAIYTPDDSGGSWASISTEGAPSARRFHTALWTGDQMIIWGGVDSGSALEDENLKTGGIYHK